MVGGEECSWRSRGAAVTADSLTGMGHEVDFELAGPLLAELPGLESSSPPPEAWRLRRRSLCRSFFHQFLRVPSATLGLLRTRRGPQFSWLTKSCSWRLVGCGHCRYHSRMRGSSVLEWNVIRPSCGGLSSSRKADAVAGVDCL